MTHIETCVCVFGGGGDAKFMKELMIHVFCLRKVLYNILIWSLIHPYSNAAPLLNVPVFTSKELNPVVFPVDNMHCHPGQLPKSRVKQA